MFFKYLVLIFAIIAVAAGSKSYEFSNNYLSEKNLMLCIMLLIVHYIPTLRKKCNWVNSTSDNSIYIMDLNQYAIKLVIYLLVLLVHWEKNAIESIAFLSKSMNITDSNQYAIELVTYLLVLVVYFYEFIVYMLLEKNAFDSIAFFSQCIFLCINSIHSFSRNATVSIVFFSQRKQ